MLSRQKYHIIIQFYKVLPVLLHISIHLTPAPHVGNIYSQHRYFPVIFLVSDVSENVTFKIGLTLSWWRSLSNRNQSIDLQSESMVWLLYDRDLLHERVNYRTSEKIQLWLVSIDCCPCREIVNQEERFMWIPIFLRLHYIFADWKK